MVWSLGLSALLGLLALALRAGTSAAARNRRAAHRKHDVGFDGKRAVSAVALGYRADSSPSWWQLRWPRASAAKRKQRLGTAESRHGRGAALVAANLGFAALAMNPSKTALLIYWAVGALMADAPPTMILAPALAALAEAAADTVSSEIGQVLGGRPFMLTTFRRVDPGTDGAVSIAGTLAGILAAAAIAASGAWALRGDVRMFLVSLAGGVFGLLFDSLLGATLERARWLNNDAVNFLSTASAAAFHACDDGVDSSSRHHRF